ncbi:exonuclease SbcCD subunit D [Anaeromyxobacter sp. SG66]|uniref:exonuclease SbcCD subunit D n=1 Tax=Anaeromyxobacter sp. SG66 TaxID=2925410 RepID=UPI001F574467|nr:exonuclease SbcCD subunit D [Anaeromyxobacter sp. SG66]
MYAGGVALRILHTSDWHLGRALHEESLLEDQAWALDRLCELLRDARPDALVVAGDVFDRAVPSAEAVSLLDDLLNRVAALGVPLVAIAGNHDSAERLAFGARLLEARGVHLRGAISRAAEPVELAGKGFLYPVPYLDPEVVRGAEGDDELRGHAAATERVLARVRADAATRVLPTVLVAHAFVQGASETPDSERPLAVGGSGCVPAASLGGFDYVALGHLHAPQEVAPAVRYSGSLLKYSFGEAGHAKGVVLAEVERGAARVELVPLGARREVVRLSGTLDELLRRPELAAFERALVEVTLRDEGYVFDAKHRLQARFAHVLNVLREDLAGGGEGTFAARVDGAGGDDLRLFEAFFETVAGATPGPEHREIFAGALAEVVRRERAA